MKRRNYIISAIVLTLSIVFLSCSAKKDEPYIKENKEKTEIETEDILESSVLTKEDQDNLTPDLVLELLQKGNNEFVNENLTIRNNLDRIRDAVSGQYPKAVILSCLDSRVPVEDVFHCGIGDIFVARVAGNIVNEDILGSLEYGCKVSGSKLIVILGHEHCGAIKSAIDDVKLGNITALLSKIKPAVTNIKLTFEGDMTSKNPEFVEKVSNQNIHIAMEEIRKKSPILKEMEDKGEIKIIGAMYNLQNGKVDFFEE